MKSGSKTVKKQEEQERRRLREIKKIEQREEANFKRLVTEVLKTKVPTLFPKWEAGIRDAITQKKKSWELVVYHKQGLPSIEERALHAAAVRYLQGLGFEVNPINEYTRIYHEAEISWYTLCVVVSGWVDSDQA